MQGYNDARADFARSLYSLDSATAIASPSFPGKEHAQ